jgi:hypothetical protein
MKDDDLNKFLSSIDRDSEIQKGKQDIKDNEEPKDAKRGKAHVEFLDGALTDKQFRQKVASLEVDAGMLVYKNGIVDGINHHNEFVRSFRKIMSEYDSDKVAELLKRYRYTFVRILEDIEKHIDECIIVATPEAVVKKARSNFGALFIGYEEKNKMDFLCLAEIFLRVRDFNSKIRREWSDLSKNIGVINLVAEGKAMFQDLDTVVNSAADFCTSTDRLLQKIATAISLPDDDFFAGEKQLLTNIFYRESFPYGYSALFDAVQLIGKDSEVTTPVTDPGAAKDSDKAALEKSAGRKTQGAVDKLIPESMKESGRKSHQQSVKLSDFTVRGTRPWNTKEPYILQIDADKLKKDISELSISFYFSEENLDEEMIEGEIKRAMRYYLGDKTRNVLLRYREFLYKFLFFRSGKRAYFLNWMIKALT